MRHKGLILGVSLGLGAVVLFLVWLFQAWLGGNIVIAVVSGLVVSLGSLVITGQAYWRSTKMLKRILARYNPEHVLYADIASYMEDGRERTGALLVTTRRLVFETPENLRGQVWKMEYAFSDIAMVKNHKGYFQMAAGGREHRFKVFRVDELVELIQQGAAEATQDAMARREMARELAGQQAAQAAATAAEASPGPPPGQPQTQNQPPMATP